MDNPFICWEVVIAKLRDQYQGEKAVHEKSNPEIWRECSATIFQIYSRLLSIIAMTHYVSRYQDDEWRRRITREI